MTREHDLEPRLGRIRDRGGGRGAFVGDVLRAARRAGGLAGRSRGAGCAAGRGRTFGLAANLRSPGRRVVVKVRIVRHSGRAFRGGPLGLHLAYLQRDGVDRTGAPGELFGRDGPEAARPFEARCEGDRHHFRLIVSPEDAADMADLAGFGRELMARAEADLGTRLDWVGVTHWNTPHPHLHILVRGRDQAGQDLVIAGEYLTRGLRARAEALVSLELGPRTAREISAGLERDTSGERWTALDRLLRARFPDGHADLRPGGEVDRDLAALLSGRVMMLERLGLARPETAGVWILAEDLEGRLRALADRAVAMGRLAGLAPGRALAELDPDGQGAFTGRLVARGLDDELSGRAYAVVDALDGRLRHVRLPDLGAAGDTPVGGIVEVRAEPRGARLLHRSDLDLATQVEAAGATWLDRRLAARDPEPAVGSGFGAETQAALAARGRMLAGRGLATVTAEGIQPAPDLLARLRAHDLHSAAARVAAETGLGFSPAAEGQPVAGLYLRRLDLASGRFAVVQAGTSFHLLPWAEALEPRLGRAVGGRVANGHMRWDLGRGLER
jgi:type IV secretory pathway VirD2 relaxase